MNARVARGTFAGRLQRGVAAVEFALVVVLFLGVLLFGIIELGRAFFYFNAAAEATRWGARLAVVCDVDTTGSVIRDRIQQHVPVLTDREKIGVEFQPLGCVRGSCRSVTVSIQGATFESLLPWPSLTWPLPAFSTTLPVESLDSANDNCPGA